MNQIACEGDRDIVGASFTLSAMSDDYVNIILNAINETDTSKVWLHTDDVTTTIRGKIAHVFDITQAIFLHASQTGEHISFQSTYSIGCPGDSDADVFMAEDDTRQNEEKVKDVKQYVAAKFSLYPLTQGHYMDTIYGQIEAMKEFVDVKHAHYSTYLSGDTLSVFRGLESAFRATVASGSSHTVMTVSLSSNSPSHK
ncbi:MAG TPA: YkoF family thiamine/hydroxymethylpyrimidine-binding protein [Bacillota bacterium]|nr:YkoF family thiamine/hydroxymethylpyrimidine-binding protein [Bacillota bacterium]